MNNVRPQIKMLTEEQIQDIHQYTMKLLATTGVRVDSPSAVEMDSTNCGRPWFFIGSLTQPHCRRPVKGRNLVFAECPVGGEGAAPGPGFADSASLTVAPPLISSRVPFTGCFQTQRLSGTS